MTIKNAIINLKKENIELSHPVRFMEIQVNRKSYRDAVVGIHDDLLIMVTKNILGNIIIRKFKLEVEDTEIISTSFKPMKLLLGEKTIIITMKKSTITLSDPIAGEFSNLISKIDFHMPFNEVYIEEINNISLYAKKTFRHGKYVAGGIGVIVLANFAWDYAIDLAREEVQNIVSDSVSDSIIEESEHIADATSTRILDRLNPFS